MSLPQDPTDPIDRRAFAALALGGATLLAAAPARARTPEQAGLVDTVVGQAMAALGAQQRALATGGTLFVGDHVSTAAASRLAMHVGEKTEIRLGENARLKIDRFIMNAGGILTLQGGAMSFNRPPSEKSTDLKIRGAFGLIAVRGTYFFAGPSRGAQGVLVLRGSVAVRSGGETVVLSAGEGTEIVRRGARPTPPGIWAQARIDEALASVR